MCMRLLCMKHECTTVSPDVLKTITPCRDGGFTAEWLQERERPMAAASIRPSFSSLLPSSVPVSLSHLLYIQDRVNWGSVYVLLRVCCVCVCTYLYIYGFYAKKIGRTKPQMHNSIFHFSYFLGSLIKVNQFRTYNQHYLRSSKKTASCLQ